MKILSLKFKTICLFLFATCCLTAQITDPVRIKLNTVFQNINKTQIPSQFLAEYAHPILKMQAFNGTLVDSIRTDMNLWRQLYATTFTAYVGSTAHPMPELSTINTTIDNVQNAIPISILHWNYNDMRSDAVTANLLSISNNQLFDVAGRTQSPYQSKTLFVAAPSVSSSNTATTIFVFRSDLLVKNTGTINAIYIDLADGLGYRLISLGTPLSISYATAGIKRMKVKIVPATGSVMESWFDFQVNQSSCTNCIYTRFEDRIQTFNASSLHSGGRAFIKFSTLNNTFPKRIKKPLIVAEGFDAFSVAPLLTNSNWSYRDLINLINRPFSEPPTFYNFNQALDDIGGYDLVFIDYNNGTDDIKRNAALLQDVIRFVNSQKQAGDAQNVVMGLSMGGLVARFGLAQMVRNSENTQTRLLITHDSPHRGANVPLGSQFLAQGLLPLAIEASVAASPLQKIRIPIPDIITSTRQIKNLLDAPATTQLLALKATSTTTTQANTFLAPGGEYRNMVDNLPTNPYQIIATSDGSQCGNQLFPPGSNLVQTDAGFFVSAVVPWTASLGFRTSLTINAAQNQVQNQVVNLRVYTQFKIFTIPINITLSSFTGNSPASALALDGAPGGTYPRA